MWDDLKIAVLIPCYNEALTIGQMVDSFKTILPKSAIYVYDNNSTDNTYEVAKAKNVIVRRELRRGKGYVVRRMFADVDADIYIMVDGDCTYDITTAPKMIQKLLDEHLDMIIGVRVDESKQEQSEAFAYGHKSGNDVFVKIMKKLFKSPFKDVCSGYRVMSHRFVKSFAKPAKGFEIETHLSVHCLELEAPYAEVETKYCSRPEGSYSKLAYFRDGAKIAYSLFTLLKYVRPLFMFGWLFIIFMILAFISWIITFSASAHETAITFIVIGVISLLCGIVLDSIRNSRQELKRRWYLSLSREKHH